MRHKRDERKTRKGRSRGGRGRWKEELDEYFHSGGVNRKGGSRGDRGHTGTLTERTGGQGAEWRGGGTGAGTTRSRG
jgi:hypothetical protein